MKEILKTSDIANTSEPYIILSPSNPTDSDATIALCALSKWMKKKNHDKIIVFLDNPDEKRTYEFKLVNVKKNGKEENVFYYTNN